MSSFKTISQIQLGKQTARNSEIATNALINYISGTGGSGYAVTTTVTNVVVTNSGFANTPGALIGYSNSFVKVFGAGFVANTAVVVNANTVPQANVTYTSSSELRVALPILANVANVTFSVVNPSDNSVSVDAPAWPGNYLVVGGGGQGGYYAAGGGGAGGFLSGGMNFIKGSTYTIKVGKGGYTANATPLGAQQGASGNNSSFHIFTAYGGGGGGASFQTGGPFAVCGAQGLAQWCGPGATCSGKNAAVGSGGGGAALAPVAGPGIIQGEGGLAVGSPAVGVAGTQGYPGAKGRGPSAPPTNRGGGGGGAGGVTPLNGTGGAGKLFPYTNTYYAGGGGGGAAIPQGGQASGGIGGGGTGSGVTVCCRGSAGTTSTGGGGGGGGGPNNPTLAHVFGYSGGPGVVILVVPTPVYPTVLAPGAAVSTPASAPGKTVLTYTGPDFTAPICAAQSTYTFIA